MVPYAGVCGPLCRCVVPYAGVWSLMQVCVVPYAGVCSAYADADVHNTMNECQAMSMTAGLPLDYSTMR